jgi:ABC-type multidrug transport system ATPase subunit
VQSGITLQYSGKVLLNGVDIDNTYRNSIIGFVPQDDVIFETMTPQEIFRFTARLTRTSDKEKVKAIVEDTLRKLEIYSVKDNMVGGVMIKGLSGGEKKRTSIGIELVRNCPIIFMDEPTTGLDSSIAKSSVSLVRNIANNEGKTVAIVIH